MMDSNFYCINPKCGRWLIELSYGRARTFCPKCKVTYWLTSDSGVPRVERQSPMQEITGTVEEVYTDKR